MLCYFCRLRLTFNGLVEFIDVSLILKLEVTTGFQRVTAAQIPKDLEDVRLIKVRTFSMSMPRSPEFIDISSFLT